MMRRRVHFVMILLAMLAFTDLARAATTGSVTITGTEAETSGIWDIGTVTVTLNGYPETVPYGQFSTPDSLASAVAAKFTSDCNGPANARSAPGGIVNFRMRGGTTLASLTITESSSVSFAGTADLGASITPTTTVASIGSTLISSGTSTTVAVQVSCGIACGSVYYQLDGGNWGTVTLNSSGQYSATTSTGLAAGLHNVVVYYQGNDTYLPSTSNPVSFTITSGSSTPTSLYSYAITPSGGPSGYTLNSNIASYSDSVSGSWTNIAYDSLNRLSKAQVSPALTSGMPYYCWTYDSFGNRLTQNNSTASFSTGCATSGSVATDTQSYGTNNRITGATLPSGSFTPDNSGNITVDPAHSYAYDVEGRLCAMSTTSGSITTYEGYLYDAEGNRVAKGTQSSLSCDMTSNGFAATAQFILGSDGTTTTVVDGSGSWVHTDVNATGELLATYDGSGLHFQLADWLGTRRMQTDYAGNSEDTYKNLPYGEPIGSLAGATEKNFTGKEYDSESGNFFFEARYFSSAIGRFGSPDPSGLIYSDQGNPQSLNLYAYALNNPLAIIDPSGLMSFVTVCESTSTDVEYPDGETVNVNAHPDTCYWTVEKDLSDSQQVANVPLPTLKQFSHYPGEPICPSKAAAIVNRALVNLILGPIASLLDFPKASGGVLGVGFGASGAIDGPAGRLGVYGAGSATVYSDKQGNLALGISPSGGRATGAGYVAGVQVSVSPFASTVQDMGGASVGVSVGGGNGLGGAIEGSSNGNGTVAGTLGVGAGGFGGAAGGGPTSLTMLACGGG